MQRLNFPGADAPAPAGQCWAKAPACSSSSSSRAVVAIDCEMVITSGGAQELARVTAVDEQGAVLLDMLVVPEAAVVNYNTQVMFVLKPCILNLTSQTLNPGLYILVSNRRPLTLNSDIWHL